MRSEPRFRVKGWLSDEEFRQLLEFSRYVGRERGLSIFELDEKKLADSALSPAEVLRTLESFKDRIMPEDYKDIQSYVAERGSITISYSHGRLTISSRVFLKPLIQELGRPEVKYDSSAKSYVSPPYLYADLLRFFRSKGLLVNDMLGLEEKAKLPRPITFKGELRPYQQEALEAWEKNQARGVIVLPTGAGKTLIAVAGIARLGVKTLIVVVTKEQVKQWLDAISNFTDAAGLLGAFYGDEKRPSYITVTTYQTAFRYVDDLTGEFAFLVFDEAHHLPADKFKAIATHMPAPFRMALSATAVREDGKHEEVFPLVGGIVYQKGAAELMEQGYLAPFIIRRVTVKLRPDEQKVYEELKRRYQLFAAGRTFEEVLEAAKKGEPNAIEALRVRAQMQSIIQESESKISQAVDLARQELEKGSKIIIFTQFKRQAEEIAEKLGAFLIHGDIDKDKRLRALEAFKRAKSGVLVVTSAGDEGLDIPDANVGILVSGTGSRRQFIQRLGRLLRPGPGKKAVLYEIVVSGTSEVAQSRRRREALG
ncbi:MAG: DEAD/DEAH box helicase family protein [Acidilobus sp.]|nr:DEAD/DEAH box helicase family protein [Acidilobus sp.]